MGHEPMIVSDIFIDEPLYIFGLMKHFGNKMAFNFGQTKFAFDLNQYFALEYVHFINRSNGYFDKFIQNEEENEINKQMLNCSILDHCLYEGFEQTAQQMLRKLFGKEEGNKLIFHLNSCNDVFATMNVRRCIKQCVENGHMEKAKCNLQKLGIAHFNMKYPVAWFQILRQELIECLRANEIEKAPIVCE